MSEKVSIIIPTYNEDKHVTACINSLLEQSYKNREIFIVDDGSSDGTIMLLDELKKENPELVILNQKHQGPAKARNLASKIAGGEILVFMDADMTFEKDFLHDLVTPIIKGKYKGTFSKEEFVGNWHNIWARYWQYNQNIKNGRMIPEDYPDLGQDFRAILKSEFLRVGGFDDTGYTDTWTLGEKLGYKPHSVVGAKYYHNNPDDLNEVYTQAKWVAKRGYKLGFIGKLAALARVFLPVSAIIGILKSLELFDFRYLIFKLVYDFGAFNGILEMILLGKLSK